jgi:hypothetical protein
MKPPCHPETLVGTYLCYAFAIATLLELPMSDMPTATPDNPEAFNAAWHEWYLQRGLVAYRFDRNLKASGLYLGLSFPDGEGHVVIMKDGELEYDPLDYVPPKPDDPWYLYFRQRPFPLDQIEIIVPRDPSRIVSYALKPRDSST